MRVLAASIALGLGCAPIVDGSEGVGDDGSEDAGDESTTGAVGATMTTTAGVDSGVSTATATDPSATITASATAVESTAPGDVSSDGDASTTMPDDTSTSTTEAGPCAFEPRDTECVGCRKTNCCAQIETCVDDPGCACVLDCLDELRMPGVPEAMQCSEECAVDFATIIPPLLELQSCQDAACGDVCGTG
jgi:hypothetical protein